MSKLDLPYLRDYKPMIKKCVERQDCVELDELVDAHYVPTRVFVPKDPVNGKLALVASNRAVGAVFEDL